MITMAKCLLAACGLLLLAAALALVKVNAEKNLKGFISRLPPALIGGLVIAAVGLGFALKSRDKSVPRLSSDELDTEHGVRPNPGAHKSGRRRKKGGGMSKYLIFGKRPHHTMFTDYKGTCIISPEAFYLVLTERETFLGKMLSRVDPLNIPVGDLVGGVIDSVCERSLPYQCHLAGLPHEVKCDPDWPLTDDQGDVIVIPREAVKWLRLGSWWNSLLTSSFP